MHNNFFKEHGLKKTEARVLVYKVLSKADSPLSALEIAKKLRKEDINLSTVYRTLNSFVASGAIKKEINEEKENIFSLVKEEDCHLLVCLKCHKSIPLAGCPYQTINSQIEEETGFKINDHNTEIYGLCPDCQDK